MNILDSRSNVALRESISFHASKSIGLIRLLNNQRNTATPRLLGSCSVISTFNRSQSIEVEVICRRLPYDSTVKASSYGSPRACLASSSAVLGASVYPGQLCFEMTYRQLFCVYNSHDFVAYLSGDTVPVLHELQVTCLQSDAQKVGWEKAPASSFERRPVLILVAISWYFVQTLSL